LILIFNYVIIKLKGIAYPKKWNGKESYIRLMRAFFYLVDVRYQIGKKKPVTVDYGALITRVLSYFIK